MSQHRFSFGIRDKALSISVLVFLCILIFNGYLGYTTLNKAKHAALSVGNNIVLEQSKVYYQNYTNAEKEILELSIKSVEDDVGNLKDIVTSVFTNKSFIDIEAYWSAKGYFKHWVDYQYIDGEHSSFWSPRRLKLNDEVIKDIKLSSYINEYFATIINHNRNTVAGYFISKKGFCWYCPKMVTLSQLPADYELIESEFFIPATPEKNPQRRLVWVPLYKDPAGLGWMVSALAPIYVGDDFIGVAAVDVTLDKLVKHHIKENKQNNSYSILLDKAFRPIALPDAAISDIYHHLNYDEQVLQTSLLDYDSDFKAVFNKIKQTRSGFEKVILKDRVLYVSFAKLAGLDWVYANVLDESQLLNVMQTVDKEIAQVADELVMDFAIPVLLFFIVLILSVSWVSQRFLKPIIRLSDITANIALSDTGHKPAVKAGDELGQLIVNFKLMKAAISRQKRTLEDSNSQLQETIGSLKNTQNQLLQSNTTLSEICTQISSVRDLKKLLESVYGHTKTLMSADIFMVGLFNGEKDELLFKLVIESNEHIDPFSLSLNDKNRPAVWCFKHKKSMVMNDVDQNFADYFDNSLMPGPIIGQMPNSLIYWPLLVGEQVIGVLSVQSFAKNAYNKHQQDMIRIISSTTAIALDNASAYQEIEAMNREIIDAHQQLTQAEKMASLGTLTAGVAHEINNPTNFVHVSAQNLAVELVGCEQFILALADDDADEAVIEGLKQQFAPLYEHLDTIKDGTERIKTIVQDLRAFSKFDGVEQKQANIIDYLASTLNLVRTKHLEVIDFETDFKAKPSVLCYPAQLNQVFMNLIVNACDAIKTRQLSQKGRGLIVIASRLRDGYLQISFRDNGGGMTSEIQKKLFEPFYTTKGVGEGTGLGLSISFGIVQKHGAQLSVESELGVGSEFILSLVL
jgi:signal transduction histidine kinase